MKLILAFPLKEISINQLFGKNNLTVYKDMGFLGHNGIDFHAVHGTPVYASHDGFASFQIDNKGGHGVVLVTDKEYEYNEGTALYKTIYWHLCDGLKEPKFASPFQDKTGFTLVKTGDLIGYADNTGVSTGDHLHFGLKPVKKGENWGFYSNLENDNGYFGAIDPFPFLPIYREYKKIVAYRQTGADVEKVQAFLVRTGFLKMPVGVKFGYYGNLTKDAVKRFQISQGIKHNEGVQVGNLTLKAMNNYRE